MLEEQGFSQVNVNVTEQGLSKDHHKSSSETKTASSSSVVDEQGDLSGEDDDNLDSDKSETLGVVDYYA